MVGRLKNSGIVKEDGSCADWYIENRDESYRYYGKDNLDNEIVRGLREEQQIAEKYESIVPVIRKCFEKYKIIDKIHAPRWVSHDDLDNIIKRYFPFGREQCGITDNVC